MARFSMPFNGDPSIIEAVLSDYSSHVASFYGSLPRDRFGGGRALVARGDESLAMLSSIIDPLERKDIEFNYVINNTDMLNREFKREYQQEYLRFLAHLRRCGVRKVTLANIFFIQFTKEHCPDMLVSASVNLKTRTPDEVAFLLSLGCDEITLHYDILKDRHALVAIRQLTSAALKLIPNDIYIMGCPWQKGHTRMQGAHSRDKGFATPYFSYYRNKCVNLRHYRPDEVFKAMWISPDQLWRYEEIGYEHFKLLDRLATTEWNLRALRAYIERSESAGAESLLGTCGSTATLRLPEACSPEDPPYPLEKLEVIPSIQTNRGSYGRLFEYFLDSSHPQECGDCRACEHTAGTSLVFPAPLRQRAVDNNRVWQSRITTLPFIESLTGFSRRIRYE